MLHKQSDQQESLLLPLLTLCFCLGAVILEVITLVLSIINMSMR